MPSDAFLQHLPSYLGFSYLGRGVSLHSSSSKAQKLLLTLDEWYLLMAVPADLECGVAPLGPPAPATCQMLLLSPNWSFCINFRVSICCTCHFLASLPFFAYFYFLSLQFSSMTSSHLTSLHLNTNGQWAFVQPYLLRGAVVRVGTLKTNTTGICGGAGGRWTTVSLPLP